ncbi:MAG: DUF1611 domain-containing protein [Pseudomonadota bacterium]
MTVPFPLSSCRLATAKWAFTTRRVDHSAATCLIGDLERARPGDLVLGRVASIGSHKKIQLTTGRGSELYPGDPVVLACGARYAPDQFEGIAVLDPKGADMLAGGGVLGRMRQRNARMSQPTWIVPLGLIGRTPNQPLNTADFTLDRVAPAPEMTVVGVVGASMNAGKTTAVTSFVHGLVRAGHQVAALKATGTGAFGDVNAYTDAGAQVVADFVDTGMVSTYLEPVPRILEGLETMLGHAARAGCRIAVVELADGVFQRETAALLRSEHLRRRLSGLIFAAPDALSATGGAAVLSELDLTPAAVTGMLTRSGLAMQEATAATGLPMISRDELMDPAKAACLLRRIEAASRTGAEPLAA